jgi:hypothetical protein
MGLNASGYLTGVRFSASLDAGVTLSGYKTTQHHILHRGREFHFVSYEGLPANLKNGTEATPATWYLMVAGKRLPVMPEQNDLELVSLTRQFTGWLDENVFDEVAVGS